MRNDWDGIAFAVVPYKETGTYVMGGIDEIQALLDDQAVRVAAVRSSPFVGHVATAAEKWADFVETLQVKLLSKLHTCCNASSLVGAMHSRGWYLAQIISTVFPYTLSPRVSRTAVVRDVTLDGHVCHFSPHSTVGSVQDTLDAWIACQAAWQYLEPIFSSPDIMAQMPEAGEKFGMVDASWRDIMDAASADPSALSAGKSRERLDTLNEANQLLDEIQKSVFLFRFADWLCCWPH